MTPPDGATVRPDPDPARVPLRRRASDQIQAAAIREAWDATVDLREHRLTFAAVELICRVYHAQMAMRGGTLR